MKGSQLVIAVLALAALVFVVVFASQYLGSAPDTGGQHSSAPVDAKFELHIPAPVGYPVESEEKTPGHQDFLFENLNQDQVIVGLKRTSCRCSSIELLVIPKEKQGAVAQTAAALLGTAVVGTVPTGLLLASSLDLLKAKAAASELSVGPSSVVAPAGSVGWVRLRWKGDKATQMNLQATIWFNNPLGKEANLETLLVLHEPLRVRPVLDVGSMTQEAVARGTASFPIYVWSSTRASFAVKAVAPSRRADPSQDPFVLGEPEPLTAEERRQIQRDNNGEKALADALRGTVMSGWRIPVHLKPLAGDGKTPFDIGPIRRHVLVSSPDFADVAKSVLVTGRVRGPVEIGSDNAGELAFGLFRRTVGSRRELITLTAESSVEEMRIDRKRTAAFLAGDAVTLAGPEESFGRRIWTLSAKVPANAVVGEFPRKDDPAYEDTAVYLEAVAKGKPALSLRVAVTGTAGE